MKKYILTAVLLFAARCLFAHPVKGLTDTTSTNTEVIKKDKLTLTFINTSSSFSPVTRQRLIDAFFKVYPEEIKEYNKKSLREVTFMIDTSYKGVAATGHGVVHFNPEWFVKHPEDIDVVTHEVMHIVQNYGDKGGPGWLTEGIADYARNQFGINNVQAGWSLPAFKPSQNYNNAYRVTARFLVWLEKNKKKGIVKKLDKIMRDGTYTTQVWTKLTGSTVDALWLEYSKNPVI